MHGSDSGLESLELPKDASGVAAPPIKSNLINFDLLRQRPLGVAADSGLDDRSTFAEVP